MVQLQRPIFLLFISLITTWLSWTILVDFVIVRTIFSTINDFFLAGELGIAIFSKFNFLELILGTSIILIQIPLIKTNKKFIPFAIISFIALMLVAFFFTYLTPKLIYLSELWKESELAGKLVPGEILDIQQEHQFYHHLYIGLDSVKLILLSLILFISIWQHKKWI